MSNITYLAHKAIEEALKGVQEELDELRRKVHDYEWAEDQRERQVKQEDFLAEEQEMLVKLL